MAGGVPGGAHMAAQLSTLKRGYTEATVGSSGSNSERRKVVTATAYIFLAFISSRAVAGDGNAMSTSPPRRAAVAGTAPLYGMWLNLRPEASCSQAPARCVVVPTPLEPKLRPSLRDFASPRSSLKVRAGTDG